MAQRTRQEKEILVKENARLVKKAAELQVLAEIYKREAQEAKAELVALKQEMERKNWELGTENYHEHMQNIPKFKQLCRLPISTSSTIRAVEFENECIFIGQQMGTKHGVVRFHESEQMMDFLEIHQGCIRDIKLRRDLQLTASLDKTMKLCSILTSIEIHTFELEAAVWSCSFHPSNENIIVAGTNQNTILQYDLRNPNTVLDKKYIEYTKGKGIHSLIMTNDGIVAGTFDGIFDLDGNNMLSNSSSLTLLYYEDGNYMVGWKPRLENTCKAQILDEKLGIVHEYEYISQQMITKGCFAPGPCWFLPNGLYSNKICLASTSQNFWKGRYKKLDVVAGVEGSNLQLWSIS